MVDSKFFNIPFATSGDKATIPEPVQPGGGISYTQGFGPDYERDPDSDPLAKRVPRDETNELYYQLSNSLRFLQLYGLPEWYAPADGPANYPISARVRYDAGAGMQAWISLVATNTAVPGSDATKWALDEYFNLPALEATLVEALAGTIGTKIITPRRMASAAQRGTWNFATATGTNTLVATLAPAAAALSPGMELRLILPNANTGAVTINVNGLGATPATKIDGSAFASGELQPGLADFVYTGSAWVLVSSPRPAIAADVDAGTSAALYVTPASLVTRALPGFVYRGSAQTIPPSSNVVITSYTTLEQGAMLDATLSAGELTIGPESAGYWNFNALGGALIPSGSGGFSVAILVNGSVTSNSFVQSPVSAVAVVAPLLRKMISGDKVKVQISHFITGQTLTMTNYTSFSGTRLGS